MSADRLAMTTSKSGFGKIVADSRVITWRNLKRIPRIPELAIFAILQSIMFVVLFAFVFGGAIPLPGYPDPGAYRQYLLPGVFAQTIAFAAATTAVGMTDDANKGIIDRFRSLPMATSAVLAGRTLADVVYNSGILIVLMVSGLVVGWRVNTGLPELLAGIGLLLLFAFPLTFISNAFVPIASMPSFLQPVAEWNPISAITAACRDLWGNPNPFVKAGSFPSEHPVLLSLIWIVVILAIFAPLGVRRYRSMSR